MDGGGGTSGRLQMLWMMYMGLALATPLGRGLCDALCARLLLLPALAPAHAQPPSLP